MPNSNTTTNYVPPFEPKALEVHFSSYIKLKVHDAFLPAGGLLQCDPLVRVQLVTVKRILQFTGNHNNNNNNNTNIISGGGAASSALQQQNTSNNINPNYITKHVSYDVKELGKTSRKLFTSKPEYNENFEFFVQDNSFLTSLSGAAPPIYNNNNNNNNNNLNNNNIVETMESYIVLTVEDNNYANNNNNNTYASTNHANFFLGEAFLPFSPHCASNSNEYNNNNNNNNNNNGKPVRVVLQPRYCYNPTHPFFISDCRKIQRLNLDDFGFIRVSWEVQMLPHGGVLTVPRNNFSDNNNNNFGNDFTSAAPVTFPLGLVLKAKWLAPVALQRPSIVLSTSVEFGGTDRFMFENNYTSANNNNNKFCVNYDNKPLFLTIKSISQLQNSSHQNAVLNFHCTVQNSYNPSASDDVRLPVVLPLFENNNNNNNNNESINPNALDRDMLFTVPVRSAVGNDFGLLLLSIRLSRKPLSGQTPLCASHPGPCADINHPQHQEAFAHCLYEFDFMKSDDNHNDESRLEEDAMGGPVKSRKRATYNPIPDCPMGAYQSIFWESEEHYHFALERRYKKNILIEAKPKKEHLRHLVDVLMQRSYLDSSLLTVLSAFFNKSKSEINALNVKEFLIAAAFHVEEMTVQEAARFCFILLRSDVETSIHLSELFYLFENCLVGKTVEMPLSELKRYIQDLVGSNNNNNNDSTTTTSTITFDLFNQYFVNNYALWALVGIPLRVDIRLSSAQRPHVLIGNAVTNYNNNNNNNNNNNKNQNLVNANEIMFPFAAANGLLHFNNNNNNNNNVKNTFNEEGFLVLPAEEELQRIVGQTMNFQNNNNNNNNTTSTATRAIAATTTTTTTATGTTTEINNNNNNQNQNQNALDAVSWRSFIVYVDYHKGTTTITNNNKNNNNNNNNNNNINLKMKRFSVTAHVNDSIYDVKVMLENTIHIAASRQLWLLNNNNNNNNNSILDNKVRIGNTTLGLPSAVKNNNNNNIEVLIKEQEATIKLSFLVMNTNNKNQKFSADVNVEEKVLHLRSLVQKKTLIPFSRIVLKLHNNNNNNNNNNMMLQDRHTLAHYGVQAGDVIDILQE